LFKSWREIGKFDWWFHISNFVNLWSISSTFYACFFCTKMLWSLITLWQKKHFRTKKAHVDFDEIDTWWISYIVLWVSFEVFLTSDVKLASMREFNNIKKERQFIGIKLWISLNNICIFFKRDSSQLYPQPALVGEHFKM